MPSVPGDTLRRRRSHVAISHTSQSDEVVCCSPKPMCLHWHGCLLRVLLRAWIQSNAQCHAGLGGVELCFSLQTVAAYAAEHKLHCSRYVGFLRGKARSEPFSMQAISFVRTADNCSDHWCTKVLDTSATIVLASTAKCPSPKANGKAFAGSSSMHRTSEVITSLGLLVPSQHCNSFLPSKQDN